MIKITPLRTCRTKNSDALSRATRSVADASHTKTQAPDLVDLGKFNAETNKIGFFKRLVKTIKVLWRANTRMD